MLAVSPHTTKEETIMPVVPILNLKGGPLPVSGEFKSPTDTGAVIEVSGSLRSNGAPVLIAFQILIDSQQVGRSQIWSNADDVHRATVPALVAAPKDFNPHTLTLQPIDSNSIGDQNDYFTAKLIY
jgi:hypothetical protein